VIDDHVEPVRKAESDDWMGAEGLALAAVGLVGSVGWAEGALGANTRFGVERGTPRELNPVGLSAMIALLPHCGAVPG